MATQGSTIFTVGTLLNRAQDQGTPVRVLVEGVWLEGTPVASDGHGVILDNPADGQYLVRTNAISVVLYLRDAEPEEEAPAAGSAHAEQERQEPAPTRTGYAAAPRRAVEAGSGSGP
ncbi:hypothetical protein [Nocardioides solisilvae]|uniref:hypothetical protein n=1 Tax=Nocardioides solisilvae TaxID=1542435 RepID=UPI000D7455F5|nr:hypothetical protein [Nocardioides solisilvae]